MQIVNAYARQIWSNVPLAQASVDPVRTKPVPAKTTSSASQTEGPDQDESPGFSNTSVTFGGALGTANASSPVLASAIAAYKPGSLSDVTA